MRSLIGSILYNSTGAMSYYGLPWGQQYTYNASKGIITVTLGQAEDYGFTSCFYPGWTYYFRVAIIPS